MATERFSPSPSRTLLRAAAQFSNWRPLLDVGSGSGRNALALARKGFSVVCVDKDEPALRQLTDFARNQTPAVIPVCADLVPERWPFSRRYFSAIVCVHFVETVALLHCFHFSLAEGGHLYVETIGGQGGNHVDLPEIGVLRELLGSGYEFVRYEERPVGPPGVRKIAAKMLARKL